MLNKCLSETDKKDLNPTLDFIMYLRKINALIFNNGAAEYATGVVIILGYNIYSVK